MTTYGYSPLRPATVFRPVLRFLSFHPIDLRIQMSSRRMNFVDRSDVRRITLLPAKSCQSDFLEFPLSVAPHRPRARTLTRSAKWRWLVFFPGGMMETTAMADSTVEPKWTV